ncbi:hypothetical protein [Streptomyces sp. NRRL S-813]|uniref:hypothetical protein n=1 Tax=Streptomyces sp. NRRL S-813 TaxID=1463919 RepID=UPI00068EC056|nr:hypothetical protein [Streptomyces sp. NRRL S-813]
MADDFASFTGRERPALELASIVARLWDTTQHYRRVFTRLAGDRRRWITGAEHRLLIEALRDQDLTSALRILELHIRRTRVELAHHPEVVETQAE